MWALLPRKTQVLIVAGAAIAVAYGVEAIYDHFMGQDTSPFKWASLAVTIVSGALITVAQAIWFRLARWFPYLQVRIFPDLNGDWEGQLMSTWINPQTGAGIAPIPTKVSIKQTLFTTHISLTTGESTSVSTRCVLEAFYEERRYRVWYSYNNDPKAQVLHRSSPHEGVAYLDLYWDRDPNRLLGRYYTARKTTGDIELTRVGQPKRKTRGKRKAQA